VGAACFDTFYFATAFSCLRASSIWSNAYIAMAGGGHRLAFVGGRVVGLFAEDLAEVGDRGVEFRDRRCGERAERETGDGGLRLIAAGS
jgi:hypothetical protein